MFHYVQAQNIASFSPASGPVGTSVTITGTGFNATASNNIVYFGATKATVNAASSISLTVTVPSGATYAPITILNTATTLTSYSRSNFITTFSPNTGSSFISSSFATKADFNTSTYPENVAIGDFDGDGKPDLAVANLVRQRFLYSLIMAASVTQVLDFLFLFQQVVIQSV